MSTMLHPKGSESPQVYWRRRALVLVIAALLVLLVVWLVWPKGSGAAAPAVQDSPTVIPPTASPSPSQPSPSGSVSPSPTGPVTCDPASSNLGLAGYQKVKQGGKQVFTVTIKNTATPCVLQVNTTNFTLTVKSGTDQIWTTSDCDSWIPAVKNVNLKQNQTYQFQITWGLARSKTGCKTTKDVIKPGTYVGTAVFGAGVIQDRQVFVITKS